MKNRKDIAPAGNRNAVFPFALLLFLLLVPSLSAAVTYEYDQLNRLTRVVYDNGKAVTYTYDAAGNIIATNEDPANGNDAGGGNMDGGGGGGLCFIATTAQGNPLPADNRLIFILFCLATAMAIESKRK